jgi:hydrogenase maturation protease
VARVRVIGIGHPDRGDDAAGRAVAARIRENAPEGADIVESDGEAGKLMDLLEGADVALIVDACLSGAEPGTIHRLDAIAAPLPRPMFAASSHAIGLTESVELARILGQLPRRCIIFAIEAADLSLGVPLSAPVSAAVTRVVPMILDEIAAVEA